MKILVAGGAGFIGSHLVDHLISQGHTVHAIDNLVTGQKKNLTHWAGHSNFNFIEGDITDVNCLPKDSYHQIYNMASPASPVDFTRVPLEIMMTGALGHKNLLEKSKKDQSRILFASTSEVYGDPLIHPQVESYYGNVNCTGIRSCYDEAKRFGEALTMTFQRYYDVDTRIVRIFNTYGPRMRPDDGRVIPNFFTQALSKKSLTVYGDGQQTRSLCHVSDLVRGLTLLMNSDKNMPVNIGNPQELTILEIADKINKLTKNPSEHSYLPLPENDPKVRQPDTTLAQEILKWAPEVLLEDGLLETMKFFQSELKQ